MDIAYWLRQRTDMIRLLYDKARVPFEQLKRDIEEGVRPWEPANANPDTDGEPPFTAEWMQAEQTRELVGMLAVSLLADTLKLYFSEMERDIGIALTDPDERKALFKKLGTVEAYRHILEQVMGDTFASCPVHFDVIEQVILARNDFAHSDNFVSFQASHRSKTLEKHPNLFFVDPERLPGFGEVLPWNAKIEVSRENLMAAIEEVEKLADWVQRNQEAIWKWRTRKVGHP